jgi:cytochrome c-type biogenesis protein CcmH
MLFWIILAGLTAAVLALLMLPAMRAGRDVSARESYDVQVFKDQLSELDRDAAAGLIDKASAEAARNEIARRILAAQAAQTADRGGQVAPWVSSAAVISIPLMAIAGYLAFGRPDLPDQPRAERLAKAVEAGDMNAMVVKVEEHLAANPNDARGWLVLAPVYRRQGRFADAADAFRKGIALSTPTPELLTDFGETLVLQNDGMVTAQAREVFDQAMALDPKFPKARFYRAVAEGQGGNTEEAINRFQALLAESPADAPWRAAVEQRLAALQPMAKGPAIDNETMQSANQMSAEDRQQMIAGMVDRLANRLAEDGDDIEGWLRLINARMVLGEKDKAQAALASAISQFAGNSDALTQLDALRQRHGLATVQ